MVMACFSKTSSGMFGRMSKRCNGITQPSEKYHSKMKATGWASDNLTRSPKNLSKSCWAQGLAFGYTNSIVLHCIVKNLRTIFSAALQSVRVVNVKFGRREATNIRIWVKCSEFTKFVLRLRRSVCDMKGQQNYERRIKMSSIAKTTVGKHRGEKHGRHQNEGWSKKLLILPWILKPRQWAKFIWNFRKRQNNDADHGKPSKWKNFVIMQIHQKGSWLDPA